MTYDEWEEEYFKINLAPNMREAFEAGKESIRAERDALKEEVSDWRDAAARAYKSPCKDEVHCTCVPLMRKQLDDVTAERDELVARVEELTIVLRHISDDIDCHGPDCPFCEMERVHPPTPAAKLATSALSLPPTGAAERIRAEEREAILSECEKIIRTGRTINNFAHVPVVVRALEWLLVDLAAIRARGEK